MHILIDLAIVLIIAGTVWVGYRKGFILGLCGILAIVISFYGANLIANTYYEEFTPILEPFVSGLLDDAVQKTVDPNDAETDEDNELFSYTGATDTPEGVNAVALMSLGRFGISEATAGKLVRGLSDEVDRVGTEFRTLLTMRLCSAITKALAFTIVFLLFMIVFAVVANLLNLQLRVPGLDLVNNIVGAGVGLVKAWFTVSLIAWVMCYAGIFVSRELLQKTVLLEFFMDHNVISAILGM